ncbi:hypothetical protein [Pararhodonellum marinum]|uniref:hypothetical protein n=1 Tax=Pararhodonellum marinum TaxID=2755358 RepID=UPI00188FF01C|nr:hypothetical protein [Pararhodonellum marinum]
MLFELISSFLNLFSSRRSYLFFLILGWFFLACGDKRDEEAHRIVNESIEVHGSWAAWESIQTLSFEKETILFDETGNEESRRLEFHEYRLNPIFQGEIKWNVDSLAHRLFYDGNEVRYRLGGNEIKNPSFLQAKQKDLDAAFYALALPFKLKDPEIVLSYRGLVQMPDGEMAECVQASYLTSSDTSSDIRLHFFDPNTHRLVAYRVKTGDHYNQVHYLGWDERKKVLFPSETESYKVDSLGNRHDLRAKYRYANYLLK